MSGDFGHEVDGVDWVFGRMEEEVGDVEHAALVFDDDVHAVEGEVPDAEAFADGVAGGCRGSRVERRRPERTLRVERRMPEMPRREEIGEELVGRGVADQGAVLGEADVGGEGKVNRAAVVEELRTGGGEQFVGGAKEDERFAEGRAEFCDVEPEVVCLVVDGEENGGSVGRVGADMDDTAQDDLLVPRVEGEGGGEGVAQFAPVELPDKELVRCQVEVGAPRWIALAGSRYAAVGVIG